MQMALFSLVLSTLLLSGCCALFPQAAEPTITKTAQGFHYYSPTGYSFDYPNGWASALDGEEADEDARSSMAMMQMFGMDIAILIGEDEGEFVMLMFMPEATSFEMSEEKCNEELFKSQNTGYSGEDRELEFSNARLVSWNKAGGCLADAKDVESGEDMVMLVGECSAKKPFLGVSKTEDDLKEIATTLKCGEDAS